MEYREKEKLLVASTPELWAIDRTAIARRYNRRLSPAARALLHPDGHHILRPLLVHRHAMGEEVEPHMRCRGLVALLGREDGAEAVIDVGMEHLPARYPEPLMDPEIERQAREHAEEIIAEQGEDLTADQLMEHVWDDGMAEGLVDRELGRQTTRDVSMIVGGDGDVADMTGLLLNPEQTAIIGVVPGTDADALGVEEASRRTGFPIERG